MAKKQSNPVKTVDSLYQDRKRTTELAEGKFTCPVETCKVAQKFRNLKVHVLSFQLKSLAIIGRQEFIILRLEC
jgi:hypothetical protein